MVAEFIKNTKENQKLFWNKVIPVIIDKLSSKKNVIVFLPHLNAETIQGIRGKIMKNLPENLTEVNTFEKDFIRFSNNSYVHFTHCDLKYNVFNVECLIFINCSHDSKSKNRFTEEIYFSPNIHLYFFDDMRGSSSHFKKLVWKIMPKFSWIWKIKKFLKNLFGNKEPWN